MSTMSTLDIEIRQALDGIRIAQDALQDMQADGHRDHRISTSMTHLTAAGCALRLAIGESSDDDQQ
jgi:5-enolpyruvylshikimate-3-phosphate synthase